MTPYDLFMYISCAFCARDAMDMVRGDASSSRGFKGGAGRLKLSASGTLKFFDGILKLAMVFWKRFGSNI